MENKIQQKLEELEKANNIKILYAVESGSRAWGFASKDSDWDVRFIYQRPLPEYLRLLKPADTIEVIDGDLDFSGWDVKKTLGLLYKSNPPLLEWLNSPQIYRDGGQPIQELRTLSKAFYSPKRAMYHYIHMAENNYYTYIRHKGEVKQKKYLYILRPLLACNWIDRMGTMPPMEIEETLKLVEGQYIHPHARNLIDLKRSGSELGLILPNKDINEYIEFQLSYFLAQVKARPEEPEPNIQLLDDYLVKQVTNGSK